MAWRCKLCATLFDRKAQLLEHYRLHHSNVSSVNQLPCLYDNCVCTFHSVNALKIHLTRLHTQTLVQSDNQEGYVSFVCAVCKFKEPFNDKTVLSHLRMHLKQHEMVDCPFKNCQYRTNVYSSFNAHKSRNHLGCEFSDFKTEIVLTETDGQPIQKMTLSSRPESVDELKTMIGEKFNLDFNFSLSYQDPDFDGQLCSLLDIEELPQKAVLKVIRSESDASSVASDDTIILPHAMTPDRVNRWPDVFPVPIFSYEVEFLLSDGNATYDRTGKTLKLSRGQKHDILETLAAKMHSFKAYPNDKEVSMVAEALVIKHPCLKEPGSQTGWYGWKNSLKFKMGNFRTKLSRAGFHEVAINSGKRSRNNPNKPSPHTNIKRPKRAEVNFLPNFPRGENAASLERLRLQIVDEVKKSDKNLSLIGKLMQTTFALRRNEIVSDDPPVDEILERWPALKMESQICAEFHRISNINLKNCFYAELDRHAPRLQRLFRRKAARTGKAAEVLSRIFQMYDLQEQVDVHVRRAAVLRALPAYLHDDDSGFLKQWDVAQSEPDIGDLPVGLLISATSDAMYLCPEKVAVVLEGKTVIDFPTFADAFVVLFALIYALHLNYPKDMANTFDFTQKVLMGLEDGNMRPRVLSLKNELLAVE
ncbi:uncharacterized protein LOC121889970 isoform X2 [Thunnus maccoyii]|uniref:uncharacterized protein LOC121889970 isoform X2 n=1 Tax=Thunnus maccoyii TaxID=8240 RepID=UPI001C4C2CF2|nr:uncharacterized protein LOC121889970 isoform X2 [Thunnus maccoyii]